MNAHTLSEKCVVPEADALGEEWKGYVVQTVVGITNKVFPGSKES